jgi:hypothetical protein
MKKLELKFQRGNQPSICVLVCRRAAHKNVLGFAGIKLALNLIKTVAK